MYYVLPQFDCCICLSVHQAFSAYYYVHLSLQRTTGVTAQTPSQLENAAETQCGMTFNQVMVLSTYFQFICS